MTPEEQAREAELRAAARERLTDEIRPAWVRRPDGTETGKRPDRRQAQ